MVFYEIATRAQALAIKAMGATVLPNTGTRLVPEYFCLIPEQIASKRNKSCIALSCLIPEYFCLIWEQI
jgi:hypothetical protein